MISGARPLPSCQSSERCSGRVSERKPACLVIRVHCKHVGGFLFQPRVSPLCIFLADQLFLLCSYHRGEMLSFDFFYSLSFIHFYLFISLLFFAGCRKLCALLVSNSVFKNSIICFCRTWLEQKPVQCRSLRTEVENHYAKCYTQTHTHGHTLHLHLWQKSMRYWRKAILVSGPEHQTPQKYVLSFSVFFVLFIFLFVFVKNEKTKYRQTKQTNSPEYPLHCFPLLTAIYFSYGVFFSFFPFFLLLCKKCKTFETCSILMYKYCC